MANTYESKFKGVEIDDGVNIATYATGTGGINVTIKGTTNVTGTGGRHLEIDGSGKQDKITDQTSLNVGGLKVTGTIQLYQKTGSSGAPLVVSSNNGDFIDAYNGSSYTQIDMLDGNYTNIVFLPTGDGTLATTNEVPAVVQIMGTGTTTVMSQKAVTDELGKKQDKLTEGTGITITTGNTIYCNGDLTGITVNTETINVGTELNLSGNLVQGGETFTFPDTGGQLVTLPYLNNYQDKLTTGSEISIKKLQATTIGAQDNGSLTIVDPLTVSNNVYVNELEATKGVFSSGAIVQGTLTGETAHFATGVTVDGYSSFNGIHVDNSTTKPICFKRNGSIVTKMYGPTSGGGELVNVYLPGKGGTLALTSDIPTGRGGSARVSSIGGKTGAITLGEGLSMSSQQLTPKVKNIYKDSSNYLCIDTN